MATLNFRASAASLLFLCAAAPIIGQMVAQSEITQSPAQKPANPPASTQPAAIKQPTPEEELQQRPSPLPEMTAPRWSAIWKPF